METASRHAASQNPKFRVEIFLETNIVLKTNSDRVAYERAARGWRITGGSNRMGIQSFLPHLLGRTWACIFDIVLNKSLKTKPLHSTLFKRIVFK